MQRIVYGCLLCVRSAVDHPARRGFITRSGVRSDASGKLVDIQTTIPADLALV